MTAKFYRLFALLLTLALTVGLFQPAQAAPGDTIRVSIDSSGTEANNGSGATSLSGDGRYVVFTSYATNLVSGDTNGVNDVFVRDTLMNTTTRVSVDSSGAQANNQSDFPAISADGRYVVFQSLATNLVSDDTTGGLWDVFIRDLVNNTTTRASISTGGAESNNSSIKPVISADGRYVAFVSYANNLAAGCAGGILLRDTVNSATTCASLNSSGQLPAGGYYVAADPAISADGRYVAFSSDATNMGNCGAGTIHDIFVRDTVNNTAVCVSVDAANAGGNGNSDLPVISADGRYVAFQSSANNLVPGDTNGFDDHFVHDRDTDTDGIFDEAGFTSTIRVSVASDGTQGNGYAAERPGISADGRYVMFTSAASNLVSGDTNNQTDIFVRDTVLNTTVRGTVNSAGVEAGYSPTGSGTRDGSISADGRFVAFALSSANLVSDDTNGATDVFRHEMTIVGVPAISLAPTSLTFASRQINTTSAVQTVMLTNNGSGVLHLGALGISGDFTLSSDNCSGQTVTAGNTCAFGVTFTPASTGPRSGSVSIPSDAASSPDSVSLSGTGTNLSTITVSKDGAGGGTVSSAPSGINCGATCNFDFNVGSSVTLTASADGASTFNGWGGACAGAGASTTCSLTVTSSPMSVSATFTRITRVISVTKSGSGSGAVSSSPAGLNCGVACAAAFDLGDSLTLTATPSTGSVFNGWSGACAFAGTNPTCTFNVTSSTTVGASFTAHAPTDIALTNASVAENLASGATVGSLSATDPDPGDTHTFSFCGGADDASFSTSGNTLKTAASFNFESKSSYAICIRVTDSTTLTFDKNFTVNVTDVNEAPQITSDGGGLTASLNVAENSTAVTTISASDPDAGATQTYSIVSGSMDASKFNINSSTGVLTFLVAPNFESPTDSGANNVYDVIVQVSDGSLSDFQSIAVSVTNVNEAPTDISLSNSSVGEAQPAGTLVGIPSATDPDVGDTATFSFCGGVNDSAFTLQKNGALGLYTNGVFDFETKNSYSVCIRATDGGGQSFTKNFTITVIDQAGLELWTPFNGSQLLINRATFQWSPVANAIGYQFQIARDSDFSSASLLSAVAINRGTITAYAYPSELTAATRLFWRVRPRLSNLQYGAWSVTYYLDTANPPSAPTLVSPANGAIDTTTAPLLDWNDATVPAGVTFGYYELNVASDAAFTHMLWSPQLSGVTNSSFMIPALAPGATYYWRVRAVAASGSTVTAYSAWSETRSIVEKYSAPPLVSPTNLSTVAGLRPTFVWVNLGTNLSYTIQISRTNAFGFGTLQANMTSPATSTPFMTYTPATNLLPRTTYFWRVKVNGAYGSGWSTVFSFTAP